MCQCQKNTKMSHTISSNLVQTRAPSFVRDNFRTQKHTLSMFETCFPTHKMRFGATPERYTSHAQSNIVAFGPPSLEHFEQSRARCHVALWVKMLLLCQCRQFFCNLCTFCFQIAWKDQNSIFVVFPHVIPNLLMMIFTVGWFHASRQPKFHQQFNMVILCHH